MSFKDDSQDDLDIHFDTDEHAENIQYDTNTTPIVTKTIPAIIRRLGDPEDLGKSSAKVAIITVKKLDVNFTYLDQVTFDGVLWNAEGVLESNEYTIKISVRRQEGYSFD